MSAETFAIEQQRDVRGHPEHVHPARHPRYEREEAQRALRQRVVAIPGDLEVEGGVPAQEAEARRLRGVQLVDDVRGERPGRGDRDAGGDPARPGCNELLAAAVGQAQASKPEERRRLLRLGRHGGISSLRPSTRVTYADLPGHEREVAQLGSAPALGAGGRGFKSPLPDHDERRRAVAARGRVPATRARRPPDAAGLAEHAARVRVVGRVIRAGLTRRSGRARRLPLGRGGEVRRRHRARQHDASVRDAARPSVRSD